MIQSGTFCLPAKHSSIHPPEARSNLGFAVSGEGVERRLTKNASLCAGLLIFLASY